MKLLFLLAAFALAPLLSAADVSLEWDSSSLPGTVTKYTVYEKVAGAWVKKGESTTTKYTVTGVVPGVHTYAVTATGPWGETAKSNEQSTPPPANPPTNLRITTIVDVIVTPAPVVPPTP